MSVRAQVQSSMRGISLCQMMLLRKRTEPLYRAWPRPSTCSSMRTASRRKARLLASASAPSRSASRPSTASAASARAAASAWSYSCTSLCSKPTARHQSFPSLETLPRSAFDVKKRTALIMPPNLCPCSALTSGRQFKCAHVRAQNQTGILLATHINCVCRRGSCIASLLPASNQHRTS